MNKPTKPGFYWALWISPAPGTFEADDLVFPAPTWEVVEVWVNYLGDDEDDEDTPKYGVSVTGVRETQWLENFKWGAGPVSRFACDQGESA